MDLSAITEQWALLQSVLGDFPIEPRYAIPLSALAFIILVGLARRVIFKPVPNGQPLIHRHVSDEEDYYKGNSLQTQRSVPKGIGLKYHKPEECGDGYYFKRNNENRKRELKKIILDGGAYIVQKFKENDDDELIYKKYKYALKANTVFFNILNEVGDVVDYEKLYIKISFMDKYNNWHSFPVFIIKHPSSFNHPDAPLENSGFITTFELNLELYSELHSKNCILDKNVKLYVGKGKSYKPIVTAKFELIGGTQKNS